MGIVRIAKALFVLILDMFNPAVVEYLCYMMSKILKEKLIVSEYNE